jgi:hypothetical protein
MQVNPRKAGRGSLGNKPPCTGLRSCKIMKMHLMDELTRLVSISLPIIK